MRSLVRLRAFVIANLLLGSGGISACALFFDVDSLGAENVAARDASNDKVEVEVDAAADPCPHPRGGPMVDGGGVCIDATKVTVAAYERFVRERAPLPRTGVCEWLDTWEPADLGTQLDTPIHPITSVNWCQALGYCTWAGKRLCGGFNGEALSPDPADIDAGANQWIYACTRGGTQDYPYGQTVKLNACPLVPIVPVGTNVQCSGPYDGLVDMVGNAAEWIDACAPSGHTRNKDACLVANSENVMGKASCLHASEASRDWADRYLGFRCCLP